MPSALQHIMSGIRGQEIVSRDCVNYGMTDSLPVPRIHVLEFESETEYDTGGPAIRTSGYKVLVIDKGLDEAEALAEQVDDYLNVSTDLTPHTMRNLQTRKVVGQTDPSDLYQYGVELSYTLIESIP